MKYTGIRNLDMSQFFLKQDPVFNDSEADIKDKVEKFHAGGMSVDAITDQLYMGQRDWETKKPVIQSRYDALRREIRSIIEDISEKDDPVIQYAERQRKRKLAKGK